MTGVATVLIMGASRGIGLETVKAALEALHLMVQIAVLTTRQLKT